MGLFEKSRNDMKDTWKNINSVLGRVSSLSVDNVVFDNFKSPVNTVCIGFQQEFTLSSFRSNDILMCDLKLNVSAPKIRCMNSLMIPLHTEIDVLELLS